MRKVPFVVIALFTTPAWAQQSRGSISGMIVDPQQAAVPGAKVVATEVSTQSRQETESSASGTYFVPFLLPGVYQVEASAPGFRTTIRGGVQVGTNEQVGLNLVLEIGPVSESVTVSVEPPMLNTVTASTGQVIGARYLESFPMNGRSPLALAQFAYGVVPTNRAASLTPWSDAGPANFSMGGTPQRSNEILLDGAQDMGPGRTMAYTPPLEAVVEVKVETFQADAAYGNTGGGAVNIVTRGGTNEFHGTAYDYNQVGRTAATPFFVNSAGQPKPQLVYNQYGVSAGGPVLLPRLFNGRDKVFWHFTFEGVKEVTPRTATHTVPTAAEGTGDFSQLLLIGVQYQIYDPLTAVRDGSRVRRSPFAGNRIPPARLNPIALNYLGYYPRPNQAGRADGLDNFLESTRRPRDFNSELARVDYNFSERHRTFANIRHSYMRAVTSPFGNLAAGGSDQTGNWGATLDDVHTFGPTLALNTRLNWTRTKAGNKRPSLGFDMTSIGFPSALASSSGQALLPVVQLSPFTTLGHDAAGVFPYDQYSIFSSLNKVKGRHGLKAGADLRLYRSASAALGATSGRYDFSTNWTRGPLDNSPAASLGQELASFLLGLPTGGQFDVPSFRSMQSGYWAVFLHDDWRLGRSLTLNTGIRYEKELSATERFDRQVVGFDFSSPNRVTLPAKSAYAANPAAGWPVSRFDPRGGIIYATPGNRAAARTDSALLSPRLGFAWSPGGSGAKSVVRGGFGIFYFSHGLQGTPQPGYTQATALVATLDGYLTPSATLSNPFPQGIQSPVGNSLGINTYLGQSVSFYNPEVHTPYSMRWTFAIQRQLTSNLMLEAGYMGNKAIRLTGNRGLNFVPREFFSTSPTRDQAAINRMTANVANPFAGLLAGTTLNGTNVQFHQITRPFSQFVDDGGVAVSADNFGSSHFHALPVRVERRLSKGLSALANYQYSKLISSTSYLNPSDPRPEKRVAEEDRTHRLTVAGVYELPFGPGRASGAGINRFANALIGGWTVGPAYVFSSGPPLTWGNVIYYGGDLNLRPGRVDGAFDVTRFNRVNAQQLQWNIRTFPSQFSSLRVHHIHNIDLNLSKTFPVWETVRIQLRADAFNLRNRPWFREPNLNPINANFGRITQQSNDPRKIQIALRLSW